MYQSAMTLKKISVLSGYSVSTVSKALNDKQDISLETRETILSIAKKHNYVPNYYAISLRKQQNKTFAIIIPQIFDNLYGRLLSEIQSYTFDMGYRLLVFQSFTSHKKEKECFKLINDGSVNGALVLSSSSNTCLMEKLQNENTIPTIFLEAEKIQLEEGNVKSLAKHYFNELLIKVL